MLVSFLEKIVFGDPEEQFKSTNEIETPVVKKTKDIQNSINLIKNKKVRRLKLTNVINDALKPVPSTKFLSYEDYESKMNSLGLQENGDWFSKLKEKKRKGIILDSKVIRNYSAPVSNGFIKIKSYGSLTEGNIHNSIISSTGLKRLGHQDYLAYSAGPDKTIKFYSFNELSKNFKASIKIDKNPIWNSSFNTEKTKIYCVSDRAKIFSLDIISEKIVDLIKIDSNTNVLRLETLLPYDDSFFTLDTNGLIYKFYEKCPFKVMKIQTGTKVNTIGLDHRTGDLYCGDDIGNIFIWDQRVEKFREKIAIEGSLGILSMGLTKNNMLLSDKSGIVSLHDMKRINKPTKSFKNLVGSVHKIFSNENLNIALVSNYNLPNNMKLLNAEAKFIYQNWPKGKINISRLTAATFLDDGWFTLGNEQGVLRLLRHNIY